MNPKTVNRWLWGFVAVFCFYKVAQAIFPGVVPGGAEVGAILPFLFALIHGTLSYGWKNLQVFFWTTLIVSNLTENLSILTGFPFGHYYYTNLFGPKLFLVPLLISVAYFGLGYLAWALAGSILRRGDGREPAHLTYTVPLLAAVLMVSWDLTFDPILSTLVRAWVWRDGGGYFGVPFSNFMGWFLTVYIFYQLFAWYLRWRKASILAQFSQAHRLQAAAMYGLTGLGTVLTALFYRADGTGTDGAGVVWRAQDILTTCGLVAIFTMLAFTFLAVVRILDHPDKPS